MRLLLPTSLLAGELNPQRTHFSLAKIISAAKKVVGGLGIPLPGSLPHTRYMKISLTGPHGAGRLLFLVQTSEGYLIPLLLRDKNDKVGGNMSPKNPEFIHAVEKNLLLALKDIEAGDIEECKL